MASITLAAIMHTAYAHEEQVARQPGELARL